MSAFDPIAPFLAYVGPGGALSAIGSFLALVGAVLLALIGFVWYPFKRLMRKRRAQREGGPPPGPGNAAG